ncbi:lysosomal Pro-Xaa carboxypeptidase [Ranunculus cassubicifolius]
MCSCVAFSLIFLLLFGGLLISLEAPVHRSHEREIDPPQYQLPDDPDKQMTFNYTHTQPLDHFGNSSLYADTTFKQKVLINYRYWGGPVTSSPIFVFLGGESPIEYYMNGDGFLRDNANDFTALLVFIEHRYYGESLPFGSNEAFANKSTLRYLNTAQALEDCATAIVYIKRDLKAETSPVIVIGGFYSGMLAAWFRVKYPDIAIGALASSAPVLYSNATLDDQFDAILTKDYMEAGVNCHNTIRNVWSKIDEIASTKDGRISLSRKFNLCNLVESSSEMKRYLRSLYIEAAQYNYPPLYPVSKICSGMDSLPNGTDILDKIILGIVAWKGRLSSDNRTKKFNPWQWQICTEIPFIQRVANNTMFPKSNFNQTNLNETCQDQFGVTVRHKQHWITKEFHANDMEQVFAKNGSNIIFSNGRRDPYSGLGLLHNISDSVVVTSTAQGSHCLDIGPASKDDPDWLVTQRNYEIAIIKGWITDYYLKHNIENQ